MKLINYGRYNCRHNMEGGPGQDLSWEEESKPVPEEIELWNHSSVVKPESLDLRYHLKYFVTNTNEQWLVDLANARAPS